MPELNKSAPQTLDLLLTRRSAKVKSLVGPGPSPAEIETILTAAARVPDHGKLAPWRFLVFEEAARERFGRQLVEILRQREPLTAEREIRERNRFLRAPLVIGVVSRARDGLAIPEWEQILSAGAVCQNLLLAVHALGFVGTWLTEWFAYDPQVQADLGLEPGERIAGFLHIGKNAVPLEERARPDLKSIVRYY